MYASICWCSTWHGYLSVRSLGIAALSTLYIKLCLIATLQSMSYAWKVCPICKFSHAHVSLARMMPAINVCGLISARMASHGTHLEHPRHVWHLSALSMVSIYATISSAVLTSLSGLPLTLPPLMLATSVPYPTQFALARGVHLSRCFACYATFSTLVSLACCFLV